jgi:L-ascorbate metabolism protein UlaG (beta-lactamase superfamily)
MQLIYIFHSGFVISGNGVSVLIDYWIDTEKNNGYVHKNFLSSPHKLYVLSSHSHPDHFNPEILSWHSLRPDIQYILSSDILQETKEKINTENVVFLDKYQTFQNKYITIETFGSTDLGISFLINMEDKKIFHAGDFNNWHWNEESTEEEVRIAETSFLKKLKILAKKYPELDLSMFPVDPRLGKDYMKGAEQFIQTIRTNYFAPMHFGFNYDAADKFAATATENNTRFLSIHNKGDLFNF